MKRLLTFIFPLLLFAQEADIPDNIQKTITQAKDYYDVSLFEEAKTILLELLYSDEGKDYEAEIRYHLGLACHYSNNVSDARIQWNQVISKYPKHPRARELNRIFSNYTHVEDSVNFMREEEFEYDSDLKTGMLFWTPTYMDKKLLWDKLKDAGKAVLFYKSLAEKYDDPSKKFAFLYRIFLLEAGINSNFYGYGNRGLKYTEKQNQFLNKGSIMTIRNTLGSMENQISDENIDQNYPLLIQAYYMAGVRLSNTTIFSGEVRPNDNSRPFFEKVIQLTENNKNNIYRIFTEEWLGK